jgi:predicted transcriptional regulator
VKQALTTWVELEEKRHQLTMESLTDVEANRIVEHESIKIWAANLDKTVD